MVKASVSGKTWTERGSEVRYSYDTLGRRSERLELEENGERSVYDGFGFEETRRLILLGDGSVAPPGFRQSASSGKCEGKYRYEGPGSSGIALSGKAVTGSRNTVSVKGIPASFKTMSGTYYAWEDPQGSVQTLTDERGNLFEKYEYDAFEGLIDGDLETGPGYGYAGKKYDPVTGQYDYGFRDYAPNLARFTTVDPIRDGANWYAYCNADPVNFINVDGLFIESGWDAFSLGLGVVSYILNVSAGNVRGTVVDAIGIVADAAALAVPGIPAGASYAISAARAASVVGVVSDVVSVVDSTVTGVQVARDNDPLGVALAVTSVAGVGAGRAANNAAKEAIDADRAARNAAESFARTVNARDASRQAAFATTLNEVSAAAKTANTALTISQNSSSSYGGGGKGN